MQLQHGDILVCNTGGVRVVDDGPDRVRDPRTNFRWDRRTGASDNGGETPLRVMRYPNEPRVGVDLSPPPLRSLSESQVARIKAKAAVLVAEARAAAFAGCSDETRHAAWQTAGQAAGDIVNILTGEH